MKTYCIYIFFLMSIGISRGQDFHLSQYFAAPLHLNPSLTGVFGKNVRLTANYRNQWFSVSSFTTYAVSIDANFFRNRLNGDFLGGGLSFYQDVEHQGVFINQSIALSLSYSKVFRNSRSQHRLGFGLHVGGIGKKLNNNQSVFVRFFEFGDNSDPISIEEPRQQFAFDAATGISWNGCVQNKYAFSLGFAMYHLGKPNMSFFNESDNPVYRKHVLHGSVEIKTRSRISFTPSFLFLKQGPHHEVNVGNYIGIHVNKNILTVYLGTMYRFSASYLNALRSDALILSSRITYRSLDVGIGYDITTSALRKASAFLGGPELFLIYSFHNKQTPQKGYFIHCPSF